MHHVKDIHVKHILEVLMHLKMVKFEAVVFEYRSMRTTAVRSGLRYTGLGRRFPLTSMRP